MQTLKPEVEARVLEAAEQAFAEAGYAGATMAGIAERAGMSTGNVYRYFADKETLFLALFPDGFVQGFLALLGRRVGSLTRSGDLTHLDAEARADAEELLAFFVAHRLRVVILLARAEGSPLASFRGAFLDALVRPTETKLRADAGGRRLSRSERLIVRCVFENTLRTLVAILEDGRTARDIEESFAGFWSYQLAGLAGLTKWVVS